MQEITTLTALVMRRARDLIADYGWPDHTDVDQRDPVNKPGWISIYVRLDAANIVHLLPLLCTGDVPAELQSAMTKIAGTPAQIILSGSRYADAPQLPEDGTQIAFPWAGEWLTEPEIQAVTDCLSRAVRDISRQVASFQAQVQVQQDALLVVDRQMSYMRQQVSARMLQRYQNNYHFGGAR